MKQWRSVVLLVSLLTGCSEPRSSASDPHPNWSVPISVDGVQLYVPVGWNEKRLWDSRPWPNGLMVDSGGWGSTSPLMGPIQTAERGLTYAQNSDGLKKRAGNPDPFFSLRATFEFPLPKPRTTWWGGTRRETASAYELDMLSLYYLAPSEEVEQPYEQLFLGVGPNDGKDVGDGWREITRNFKKRPIYLRFDRQDWQVRGGPLPRRLAASFSHHSWSHYMRLDRPRWNAKFETYRLPTQYWRARFVTAEELFDWLQTRPERRVAAQRFLWWSDLRFRPSH